MEMSRKQSKVPMAPQTRQIFWIDVLDHLPDDEITVLGYVGNGEMELVYHAYNRWCIAQTTLTINIFFWAELPNPPEFHSAVKKGGAQ